MGDGVVDDAGALAKHLLPARGVVTQQVYDLLDPIRGQHLDPLPMLQVKSWNAVVVKAPRLPQPGHRTFRDFGALSFGPLQGANLQRYSGKELD